MLSDENRDVIMEIKVNIAKQQERIIFLMRSNEDIEQGIKILRREQEARFRWTVLLFVSLLGISIGVCQAIMRWGS